jgi:hypothetical protein
MRLAGLTLLAAVLLGGCASKITGETSELPPKGGPKASAKHPPGESEAFLNRDRGK